MDITSKKKFASKILKSVLTSTLKFTILTTVNDLSIVKWKEKIERGCEK